MLYIMLGVGYRCPPTSSFWHASSASLLSADSPVHKCLDLQVPLYSKTHI